MDCQCKYFVWNKGELICSVCGKPARSRSQAPVEDKIAPVPESKIDNVHALKGKRRS